MPNRAFDITATTPRVTLAGGKGEVRLTVSNALGRPVRINAYVEVEDRGRVDWIALQGEFPRGMEADHTFELAARIAVPEVLPEGHYRVRLVVASTESPDTERAVSQWIAVEHTAEAPRPFPWWIVALAGGVLLIALGGYGLYRWLAPGPMPALPDAAPPDAAPPDASPPPDAPPPPPLGLEEMCVPGGVPACRDGLYCSPTLKACIKTSLAVGDLCDLAVPPIQCPRGSTCQQAAPNQVHRCWPVQAQSCRVAADCGRQDMICLSGKCTPGIINWQPKVPLQYEVPQLVQPKVPLQQLHQIQPPPR